VGHIFIYVDSVADAILHEINLFADTTLYSGGLASRTNCRMVTAGNGYREISNTFHAGIMAVGR
jgi:hypothetical protein